MDSSILSKLERAELTARERSLAASNEAESLLANARADARRIEASVEGRIADAIAARRAELLEAARADARSVEAELAGVEAGGPDAAAEHVTRDVSDRLVRAVLAEPAEQDA